MPAVGCGLSSLTQRQLETGHTDVLHSKVMQLMVGAPEELGAAWAGCALRMLAFELTALWIAVWVWVGPILRVGTGVCYFCFGDFVS